MAEPIRIRAIEKDGLIEAHVLMPHPMETGFRKDEGGNTVAAHYITEVRITVAGRTVFSAMLSRAVSQDPLLHFRFRGARAGDSLTVAWTDTAGERRLDSATILAV